MRFQANSAREKLILVRNLFHYGWGVSSTTSDPDGTVSAIEADEHGDETTAGSARPMGQLVLRLSWVEPDEEGGPKEGGAGFGGHTTLVIHGASGLAKADL